MSSDWSASGWTSAPRARTSGRSQTGKATTSWLRRRRCVPSRRCGPSSVPGPPASRRRSMSNDHELLDDVEAGELAVEYDDQLPEAVLQWALERYGARIALC